MSVIWEDPPPAASRAERFNRPASPLRKETDDMLETLRSNQGAWARMWDLDTKEEARKRCNYAGQKGFSFSVRQTQHGWSVFGRYNGEPEPEPEQPEPGPQGPPDGSPPGPGDVPQQPDTEVAPAGVEAVREPTFQ